MSDFGKKGGSGPTAGKVSATYEAKAPDGTTLRKRVFYPILGQPVMAIWQHEGRWKAASMDVEGGNKHSQWTHFTWVKAWRVS